MPKSKRRPKVVAKARAQARRQQSVDSKLLGPPWQVWLEMSQDPAVDEEMLRFMEHYPFRLDRGDWTSLAQMAEEAGQTIADVVESQTWLQAHGHLAWDASKESVILTVRSA